MSGRRKCVSVWYHQTEDTERTHASVRLTTAPRDFIFRLCLLVSSLLLEQTLTSKQHSRSSTTASVRIWGGSRGCETACLFVLHSCHGNGRALWCSKLCSGRERDKGKARKHRKKIWTEHQNIMTKMIHEPVCVLMTASAEHRGACYTAWIMYESFSLLNVSVMFG